MGVALFRFYEELNDFLTAGSRGKEVSYSFSGNPSVKDAIEALGVPHVEVDLILANSSSVDFSYKLRNSDYISVYPVFESFDITPVTHLRAKPLRDMKFITDVHLGKLAKYLRLCGFDTLYDSVYSDDMIINTAITEKRIILTRDRVLLKNKKVTHGYWLRSEQPGQQLKEIFTRLDLKGSVLPFSRCLECNSPLINITKQEIIHNLQPKTRQYYDVFKQCPQCGRIYWEGSHYERMRSFIEKVIED